MVGQIFSVLQKKKERFPNIHQELKSVFSIHTQPLSRYEKNLMLAIYLQGWLNE